MSLGPACWLVQHGFLAACTAAPIYDPLFWLEFHAPEALQSAASRWAKLLGVETSYIRLRDAPFPRSYQVGDFAFRWKDGHRTFDAGPWLMNWITTTIEPDSWEDLSGPGLFLNSSESQSLDVLQSRRVHAAVAAFLDEIRIRRRSAARGRDLDCQALGHVLFGFYSEPKFHPGCIRISANPLGDQLVVGDASIANFDELMEFLQQLPQDSLRAGVIWNEWRWEPIPPDADRLKLFCQARDVDLFIRPNCGNVIGQPLSRDWWVVRASDSIYLDPE